MNRVVIFQTSSTVKVNEVMPHFSRYGIMVIQHQDKDVSMEDVYRMYSDTSSSSSFSMNVFAVIREKTHLFNHHTSQNAVLSHLELVDHISTLTVYRPTKNELIKYTETTSGYIDRLSRGVAGGDVFGWDDMFVVTALHETYHSLRKRGLKISSRDLVVSHFLIQHVHYKNLIDLKHNPQNFDQSVSFETDGMVDLYTHLIQNNPAIKKYGIHNIISHVFSDGIYFMAPKNRRLKLNWNPGLNPLPLVRKEDDPLHEITYAVHDMGHFAFRPDLIWIGDAEDPSSQQLQRKIYLMTRMMSEAITLPTADMFFVHGVLESGNEYSSREMRRIYPLFEAIVRNNKNVVDTGLYERILHASTHYTLLGDETYFQDLITGNDIHILTAFMEKYSQFFIQDYIWTERNLRQLESESDLSLQWWKMVSIINDRFDLGLKTVTDYIKELESIHPNLSSMNDVDLVNAIFNHVLMNRVTPIINNSKDVTSFENDLARAFIRYMCNQLHLFIRYSQVPTAHSYKMMIFKTIDAISDGTIKVTSEVISSVRSFINEFIEECVKCRVMTPDDAVTFSQLYAVVDPFIVNYDIRHERSLKEVSHNILSSTNIITY